MRVLSVKLKPPTPAGKHTKGILILDAFMFYDLNYFYRDQVVCMRPRAVRIIPGFLVGG